MKTVLICGILTALTFLFVPSAPKETAAEAQNVVLLIETPLAEADAEAPQSEKTDGDTEKLRLRTENGTVLIDEMEYLTEVVLSEMPASFEPEALKAQAVTARTFLARQRMAGKHTDCDICADSACCQAWTSRGALEQKLGDTAQSYWDKAADAVSSTEGEILTYDGTPIEAVYFSCSGGSTEAAVSVWGTDVPYLQAVESPGEQDALRYESEAVFSEAELRSLLAPAVPEADLSSPVDTWFSEPIRTNGGGGLSVEIGGAAVSGTKLRSLLGLNSTKFTIRSRNDEVVFQVLGFGHRVGMSQYGANAMAKLGFDYQTILQYYYRGVKIENASQAPA